MYVRAKYFTHTEIYIYNMYMYNLAFFDTHVLIISIMLVDFIDNIYIYIYYLYIYIVVYIYIYIYSTNDIFCIKFHELLGFCDF